MGFTLNQLEQERQIRKLQKKEDKDTKDYEQLSNLPKINDVELKGNKTTSDLGINADNVMLSDGVTSVEDALDGLKILKDTIDLSSYNSISNMYTFPKDGYLFLVADYETSTAGFAFYTNLNQWMGSIKAQAGFNGMQVKKGTRGFCNIIGQGSSVKFCPFYVN